MENLTYPEAVSPEDNKKTTLLANSVRYGLITAAAYVLFSLLMYSLDLSKSAWTGYLAFIILIAGIVVGTKHYRDKINGGYLSYGRCLGSGVLISLMVAVIMAVYTYFFFAVFSPESIAQMKEAAELKMMDQGLSDEQIDQAMAVTGIFTSPATLTIISLISMVFYGFIFSLITSIFLKKEDKSFENTFNTTT